MAFPSHIGDFSIVREIGRGGMGAVFEAQQASLERRVALKVLSGIGSDTPEAIRRLHREATAAGRVSHPGIVQVYAIGEDQGLHFIVMELVEGLSFAEWLRKFWDDPEPEVAMISGGFDETFHIEMESSIAQSPAPGEATVPLPRPGTTQSSKPKLGLRKLRTVVALLVKAARALHAAHEQSVLHRDVKPGNLLITPLQDVKVVDFGLARSQDLERITATGDVLGTPSYVSPEQLHGQEVDARTDLYSLGVTAFEALTHELPFKSDSVQGLMHRILNHEPPTLRKLSAEIPRDVETIILKSIEKNPDRRYASLAAFADDLDRWLRDEPIHAVPAGPLTRMVKFARRRRTAVLATIAVLIAAGIALSFVTWGNEEARLRAASDNKLVQRKTQDFLERGIRESAQGNWSVAIGIYDKALDLDPKNQVALVFRGLEALNNDDFEGAERDFQSSLSINSQDAPTRLAYAALLRAQGKLDQAKDYEVEVTSEGITSPLELDSLGLVHRMLGRYEKGLHFFQRARDLDRTRVSSLTGVGFCSFFMGRQLVARENLTVLRGVLPVDNPMPEIVLIYSYYRDAMDAGSVRRQQLISEAERVLAKIIGMRESSPLIALACVTIDSLIPKEDLDQSDHHDPITCFDSAVAIHEQLGPMPGRTSPSLFHEIAAMVILSESPELAKFHAEKALSIRPGSEMARMVLGKLALSEGRIEDGLAALRLARTRSMDSPYPIQALFKAMDTYEQVEAAIPESERITLARDIVRIRPDNPMIAERAADLLIKSHPKLATAGLKHAADRYRAINNRKALDRVRLRLSKLKG